MCLAVPVLVKKVENDLVWCQVGHGETQIKASLLLIQEDVVPGDYVLVHAGFVIQKLDLQEARQTLDLLQEALDGGPNFLNW